MPDKVHGFTEQAARRVVRAVREVESGTSRPTPTEWQRNPRTHTKVLEGTLDGALAAPVDFDTPSTALLNVRRNDAVGGLFVDIMEQITVTNRDPNFSAAALDVLLVARFGEEWRPFNGGGGGTGGGPLGPTLRVTVTGVTVPGVGVILVLGDCDAAGGSMTINLDGMSPNDGDFIAVKNTTTIPARTVSVTTLHSTEGASFVPAMGGSTFIQAIYEASTSKWWHVG